MTLKTMCVMIVTISAGVATLGAQQVPVFRSTSSAVRVPVVVFDKNRPVPNLNAANFLLTDNGVPQQISAVDVESIPADVTALIDTSGSVSAAALDQAKADIQEMSDLLHVNDRLRLLTFSGAPATVAGFRPAGSRLPLDALKGGGATAFYDALALALTSQPSDERLHLIFAISDGRDTASFTDGPQVAAIAKRANALLCIALQKTDDVVRNVGGPDVFDPSTSERSLVTTGDRVFVRSTGMYVGPPNRDALSAAATATGCALYDNPSSRSLSQAFKRVIDDFYAGYVLSYVPAGVASSGFHTIEVKTKTGNYLTRYRPGYDAGTVRGGNFE